MAEQVEDYINSVSDPRERRALQALLDHINERTATFPLKVANTEVTSTAAELNKLDGVTRTMAEINALLQCSTAQYKVITGTVGIVATTNVDTGLSSVVGFFAHEQKSTYDTLHNITWRTSYEANRVTIYGWRQSSTAGTITASNLALGGSSSLEYMAIGLA